MAYRLVLRSRDLGIERSGAPPHGRFPGVSRGWLNAKVVSLPSRPLASSEVPSSDARVRRRREPTRVGVDRGVYRRRRGARKAYEAAGRGELPRKEMQALHEPPSLRHWNFATAALTTVANLEGLETIDWPGESTPEVLN